MSRRVSLNARNSITGEDPSQIWVVLMKITHPDTDAVIRLSTDNTERLSIDPLLFGTKSTWLTSDPEADPFLFIIADAQLPDESEDAPAEAQIVLSCISSEHAELLRSFISPARLDMAVVLASSPDLPEAEWHNIELVTSEIDEAAEEITLTFSREYIELEQFPPGRMIRLYFPALHL
ncbi:hypothetical protein [uncultured Celeribacter sp.]|uniref:hypothetical protein n=1 Tax=uncultured Celeribacter sp. TaxID=1303376 RepID=UPI002AA7A4DD|nr:hypothetical protein [uncultured Celeribacter sp.]